MEESNDPPRSTRCCDWQQTMEDWNQRAQKLFHEEPAKAVGLAVLGGVILTIFPVGRVLGGVVRLAFALIRPLVLVLGAMKLYEEFEKRQKP